MSSHHFVREGQEPALLIHADVPFSFVSPLLEWSPFVAVTSACLPTVITWGVRIDVVIADDACKPALHDADGVQPLEVISVGTGEDEVMAGIRLAAARGQGDINVVVESPALFLERVDLLNVSVNVTLMTPGSTWHRVTESFRKWVPKSSRFLLYDSKNEGVTFKNVALSDNVLTAVSDGMVSFSSPGRFWLAELS